MNLTPNHHPPSVASHSCAVPQYAPILFSTTMVNAILAGNKTQTRRVIKFPADFDGKTVYQNAPFGIKYTSTDFEGCIYRLYPKYQPGTILWVRETWQHTINLGLHPADENSGYIYKASENGQDWQNNTEGWQWKPSIFMPKTACRIFLQVQSIRAESLQDITEANCITEGIIVPPNMQNKTFDGLSYAYWNFRKLWMQINGTKSWELNPWVWVITFKKIPKPENWP